MYISDGWEGKKQTKLLLHYTLFEQKMRYRFFSSKIVKLHSIGQAHIEKTPLIASRSISVWSKLL